VISRPANRDEINTTILAARTDLYLLDSADRGQLDQATWTQDKRLISRRVHTS